MNKNIKKGKVFKTYNQEFRETAVKLVLTSNKPMTEVAKELEIPIKTLYAWVKKSGGNSKSKNSAEDELRKLQKKFKELELENEILKKGGCPLFS